MPGSKALRKIQLGRETVMGTPVAATTIWRGMGTILDESEYIQKEEDVGMLSPIDQGYVPFKGASIPFDETEATFEQLLHIGEAGIKTVGTGASDGTGSGKIYAYPFPTSTVPTIKTYTIEGGDNQQAEEIEYCFVEEFSLSGSVKEAWKVSANWRGRKVTKTTFTAAIAIPTAEEILFQKTKLYIDAVGGTIGGTQKANTLLKASFSYKTGIIPVWTGDGSLEFSLIKPVKPEAVLEITFEHDTSAVAEKDAWLAKTTRLIRLKAEGSTNTTPGTTYSYKTMILDLVGKWQKFDKIDEIDGNDVVTGTFIGGYNSTAANFGQLLLVAELATVP